MSTQVRQVGCKARPAAPRATVAQFAWIHYKPFVTYFSGDIQLSRLSACLVFCNSENDIGFHWTERNFICLRQAFQSFTKL